MNITLYTGRYGKELCELGDGFIACAEPTSDINVPFTVSPLDVKAVSPLVYTVQNIDSVHFS